MRRGGGSGGGGNGGGGSGGGDGGGDSGGGGRRRRWRRWWQRTRDGAGWRTAWVLGGRGGGLMAKRGWLTKPGDLALARSLGF